MSAADDRFRQQLRAALEDERRDAVQDDAEVLDIPRMERERNVGLVSTGLCFVLGTVFVVTAAAADLGPWADRDLLEWMWGIAPWACLIAGSIQLMVSLFFAPRRFR